MLQMAEEQKKNSRATIVGATFKATVKGFEEFVRKANEADAIGYDLVTMVKVEAKLAAVWRLRQGLPPDGPYSSFLGEDDEPPIENHGW